MRKSFISMCLILLLFTAGCTNTTNNNSKVKENRMNTKIEFIRNATMKIEYGGKTFLTDPMFAEKETLPGFLNPNAMVNPTVDLPVSVEDIIADFDGVLLSHSHIPAEEVPSPPSDHFDPVAIETLSKDTAIYIQPFDEAGLKRIGFTNTKTINDTMDIDGVTISRITGRHVDLDPLLPMIGESSGYILKATNSPTILWTGDTLLTEDMKSAIKDSTPDIIIAHPGKAQLPIDAEGNMATLLMGEEEIIEIAKLAPNAKIIAIHMEALDHCTTSRESLRKKASEAGISEEQLIIPVEGEVITFN